MRISKFATRSISQNHMLKEIKQNKLLLFFLLTFFLSWIIWLPGMLITNNLMQTPSDSIMKIVGSLGWIGGLMPSLVAFFLIYKERGWNGIKALISKVFKLRLGSWYFPMFLIFNVSFHILWKNAYKLNTSNRITHITIV